MHFCHTSPFVHCVRVRACALLGPDVFLISVDERAKHDQQFLSLSPNAGGYITGNGSQIAFFPKPSNTSLVTSYLGYDLWAHTSVFAIKVIKPGTSSFSRDCPPLSSHRSGESSVQKGHRHKSSVCLTTCL